MHDQQKTGWPAPELAQDDHRGLFRWFASKPDARLRVREAIADLCNADGTCSSRCQQGKDCEGSRRASCMALGLHRLVQVDEQPKSRAIDYLMAGLVVFFVLGLVFSCFK